jgi:hypothetical protein
MTRLEQFMRADTPSLSLQVKFLKAGNRTAKDSPYGMDKLAVREPEVITTRKPESIWLLAHKIVAFSQNYIQQSNWNHGLLLWLFIQEPWWTVAPRDHARYSGLFTKTEWLSAHGVLTTAYARKVKEVKTRKFTTEDQALLWFLKDSCSFVEQMYGRP